MRIGAGSILGSAVKRQQASKEYKYYIETERAIQKAAAQKIAAAIKRQQQPSPSILIQQSIPSPNVAATKIQSAIRKRQAKQELNKMQEIRDIQDIIVPSIQAAVRGRIARKKVQALQEEKKIKNAPATKIAKVIKGAIVRKSVKPIIERYKKEVKNIERDKYLETVKAEDRIAEERKLIAKNKIGIVGGLFTSKEEKEKKQKIISDAERAIKADELRLKNVEKQIQKKKEKVKEIFQQKLDSDIELKQLQEENLSYLLSSQYSQYKEKKQQQEIKQTYRRSFENDTIVFEDTNLNYIEKEKYVNWLNFEAQTNNLQLKHAIFLEAYRLVKLNYYKKQDLEEILKNIQIKTIISLLNASKLKKREIYLRPLSEILPTDYTTATNVLLSNISKEVEDIRKTLLNKYIDKVNERRAKNDKIKEIGRAHV
jgi:hypothetical protein